MVYELVYKIIESKTPQIELVGMNGMGRNLIAKNALSFLHKRKLFSGGIFYLDLYGIKYIE